MAICTGNNIVQTIERTECMGNSLTKINSNFAALDTASCNLQTDQLLFVGSISYFPTVNTPTGWLALSGQTVSRLSYPNLWTFANNSGNIVVNGSWVSNKFSYGDGSTNFRLPDLRSNTIASLSAFIKY